MAQARNILLTGATGVVGSALFARFISEAGSRIYLLLRADSDAHATQRFRELCLCCGIDCESAASRCFVLRGDVAKDRLGLSPETYQQLTNEVTDIVHSAASVKLNQTLSEARRACLAPVRHIVLLARGCSENLRKLEYLSTVGVAGRQPGIFREQPVTNHFETRNTYEQAKREAEMLLWQECMRELPVTIYRPSMVVGNSGSGAVLSFQVFYHLLELVLGRRSRGFVPELCAARVDTVPVDYLAEAIYAINSKAGAVGSIFHLCSGTRAIELKSLASTARLLFEKRGLHVPKSRSVPLPIFRAALSLCRLLPNDKVTRRVRSIEPFLQYLASPQIFDNGLSSEYLTSQGIVLPLPENYLRPVIDFYLDSITRS